MTYYHWTAYQTLVTWWRDGGPWPASVADVMAARYAWAVVM